MQCRQTYKIRQLLQCDYACQAECETTQYRPRNQMRQTAEPGRASDQEASAGQQHQRRGDHCARGGMGPASASVPAASTAADDEVAETIA